MALAKSVLTFIFSSPINPVRLVVSIVDKVVFAVQGDPEQSAGLYNDPSVILYESIRLIFVVSCLQA